MLNVVPSRQIEFVVRWFVIVLRDNDSIRYNLSVLIGKVIPPELNGDRGHGMTQFSSNNAAIRHRWSPNGHLLLPPYGRTKSNSCACLDIEDIFDPGNQVSDSPSAISWPKIGILDLDFIGSVIFNDKAGDDTVGSRIWKLPLERDSGRLDFVGFE